MVPGSFLSLSNVACFLLVLNWQQNVANNNKIGSIALPVRRNR